LVRGQNNKRNFVIPHLEVVNGELRGAYRLNDDKLVFETGGARKLYDVATDPSESNDRYNTNRATADTMEDLLMDRYYDLIVERDSNSQPDSRPFSDTLNDDNVLVTGFC